ncbi:MAG: hypothetical protein EXS05_17215 [Planctomycetaceae bacterium]|nr:hypothetical protein [Planctomycetaceae bacterium]
MGNWIIGSGLLAAAAIVLLGARPLRDWMWRRELAQARQSFRRQREVLEAKFFDLASKSGKPRDLRWLDCDWLDAVTFARDRQTGLLTAFVAVNIRFEAVEGGDMEGLAAVGNIRDAAAVFHYQGGHWGTGGRTLFNMNPADALVRLQSQFEPLPT